LPAFFLFQEGKEMDEKSNMEILLDIQNTLGTVVEATSSIKSDIVELKEKDLRQSDELEKAYAKAKSRQDSIRDDLQHQIDNNNQLIIEIKNAITSLSSTISNVVEQSKKQVDIAISEFMTKIEKRFEANENEINTLKNEKKNHVYSRWEQIREKLFWIAVAIIFAAVFKYLNFTPPKL
jgi:predicted  nucleic acid-binding Zn-ribbon protein